MLTWKNNIQPIDPKSYLVWVLVYNGPEGTRRRRIEEKWRNQHVNNLKLWRFVRTYVAKTKLAPTLINLLDRAER